jgi:hypothetical protein
MEYLEVFVTKKPKDEPNPETTAKSIEWGDDGIRWSEDDQLAPYIIRHVKDRHLVLKRIEEAFKETCFVFGDGDGLVHLVIIGQQSKRSVVEQVKEIIETHKDSMRPSMLARVRAAGF